MKEKPIQFRELRPVDSKGKKLEIEIIVGRP